MKQKDKITIIKKNEKKNIQSKRNFSFLVLLVFILVIAIVKALLFLVFLLVYT